MTATLATTSHNDGQMVKGLELTATATSQDEWWGRIEFLLLG
jgi:hypothetical protein